VGTDVRDPFVSEPETIAASRAVVFDDHVRPRRQLASRLRATLALEVQRDAAEVAIGEQVERADSDDEELGARPAALPCTAPRRLDLDHVRTHVGQVLARGRSEEKLRERKNSHAGQKPEAWLLAQSTSCITCVSTATSSPYWFLTSIFATIRSRSRYMPLLSSPLS